MLGIPGTRMVNYMDFSPFGSRSIANKNPEFFLHYLKLIRSLKKETSLLILNYTQLIYGAYSPISFLSELSLFRGLSRCVF